MFKTKKALAGILLSAVLAGGVAPVASVLAADEVVETAQAVEVAPATEAQVVETAEAYSATSKVTILALDTEITKILKDLGQVGVLAFGESKIFTAPSIDGYSVKRYHVTEVKYNSIVVAGDGASVTIHKNDTEGWGFSIVFFMRKPQRRLLQQPRNRNRTFLQQRKREKSYQLLAR